MTNRTVTSRGTRLAALAALFAVLVGVAPVRAASSIDIEARALVAGRYEVGGWMALSVTLVNDGEPTQGYLSSSTEVGSVRRFVVDRIDLGHLRPQLLIGGRDQPEADAMGVEGARF